MSEAVNWHQDIFDVLNEQNFSLIAHVPDAGHTPLIRMCEASNEIDVVTLTTEQDGVGLLSGAWAGGRKGVLLMQSSGVGNCLNTLALQTMSRFPLLMLVTMRGDWAEFNPWQNPMGQATEAALKLMGVRTWRADQPDEVAHLVHGAATMAFNGDEACAVLLGQSLIGEKKWVK